MTEFELRERMFEYIEAAQATVLLIQKDMNYKLKTGVPIDPAVRYELISNQFKKHIDTDTFYSSLTLSPEPYASAYIDTLINQENPFQTIFAYILHISQADGTESDEVFMVGEEERLLEKINEWEASNQCG